MKVWDMSVKEEGGAVEGAAEKPKRKRRSPKPAEKKPKRVTKRKAEAPEEAAAAGAEAEARPNAKGDFVLLELTGRLEGTGEVFDTTDEERAKSAGLHGADRVYGPRLVVVGEGWVPKGLDARLEGMKVGEEAEAEVPAGDAFGERNPDNVRMVPFRLLRSKGISPTVGAEVEVDGRTAVVRSIGAGRVQLDYNHPLAGRKLIYSVKVVKRHETGEEKVRALLARRFQGVEAEKFGVKLSKKSVRIEVPEEIHFAENLPVAKRGAALDIQRFLSGVDEVLYVEAVKRRA